MLYNEEIELDEDFEGVDDSEAEVVTEFDEVDENTDYDNNYTYVDIDFQQDAPQLIDTPTPVVDPVVEETELIPDPEFETVTETYEIIIQEYSQEYLQALEDDGYTFYVIYEDGTEDEVDISEIEEPTTSIEFLDDEAYVLANSILEHFWDDNSGVHVTQDSKEDWEQLVDTNFPDLDATHPHHNIIVNSYGVLIRSALKNLVQLSRSALAFYDGLGNNSSNIISTFGRGGIQIGPTDQKHLVINNNGITVYNGDGTVAPLTASNIQAIEANIQTLTAATADIATIRANSAKVANLTAQQLEADHATVGALDTNYAQVNMANVNNAWIQNGTVKDGAITNAMIHSVSANKLTAGTIDASNITVTNLNADNITTGTINGQRIGSGSLSLDKLEDEVYTKDEVDDVVDDLNDRIDGAIETFTGTVIPTLNNTPASAWTTNDIKDTHVGDVYYVVNSQSDQNGYCYRFSKINNAYSWQLIKDSDVTAALARLTTAEGKIGTIETFDSTVSSFMTNTDQELTSIKSAATTLSGRVTTAEGTLLNKVDTTTFSTLSQTVDGHSSSITQLTTETSTLTQAVDTLNTKTSSDSGNIIQFDDSIGFKEIVVHGKSIQNGTPTPEDPVEIESVDNLTLNVYSKNLFDRSDEESGYIWTDGEKHNASEWLVSSFIPVVSGVTYTFTPNTTAGGTAKGCFYDVNKTFIVESAFDSGPITITAPQGAAYARFSYRNTSTNVQLELGSTATYYEPYQGQSIDIPLGDHQIRSLPDGTEDTLTFRYIGPSIHDGWGLYNAELVQHCKEADLGDLTWTYSSTYEYFSATISGMTVGALNETSSMCTEYEVIPCTTINSIRNNMQNLQCATRSSYNQIYIKDPDYTDATDFTAAVTGYKLVYPLDEPVTYSLSVVELPLSEDLNLWASTSPSTVIDATWWHVPGRVDKNTIDISLTTSNIVANSIKVNEVSDTVDEHTQKIGVLETTVESKADSSDVETISNTLNSVSQTSTSNSQKITNLTTRLGTNADGTAGVNDIVAKESALEQDLDTFKTTVSSTYFTKTEVNGLITAESQARASAIEQSANQISLSVSQTYSTKTELSTAQSALENSIDSVDDRIDNLKIGGENLMIFRTVIRGRLDANGNVVSANESNTHRTTDYISVKSDADYCLTRYRTVTEYSTASAYVVWYDDEKIIISRTTVTNLANVEPGFEVVHSPETAAYARVCFSAYFAYATHPDGIKFEEGNVSTAHTFNPEDLIVQYNLFRGTNVNVPLEGFNGTATIYNGLWKIGSGTASSGGGEVFEILDPPAKDLRYGMRVWSNTTGNKDLTQYRPYPIDSGKPGYYSLSFWLRASEDSETEHPIAQVRRYYSSAANTWTKELTVGDNWEYMALSYWLTEADVEANLCQYLIGVKGKGCIEYCGLKLERGSLPTKWAPSLDDTALVQTHATKDELAAEIDGIEVGGRNLLLGTATPLELSIGYLNPYQISSTIPDLNANDILTLSFDAKATISRWIDFYWVNTNLSTGGSSYNNTNNFYPSFQLTTDWEHYTYTGVVGVNVADILGIRMRQSASSHGTSSTGCTVYLKNVKLEKGNKATDWSPAPEDTDAEISGLKTRVSTAESSITQNATNIELKVSKDGVISSINQSAESIKIQASKVEIDGTAIFNSISSSVDTSISNSLSNAKLVKTTQDQWYSSTSATTKAGGSWATTQPSIVAGRYIWQRQYVTYSDNTTAYLPSEEGVCTQGQTDLSGYSTTTQMNSAIGTAKEEALAVANSKRRIFTTTPTVPYDVGDLWVNGSSVKYCSTAKTDSGTYSENDWTTTATDDTGVSALQQQINDQLGTTQAPYTQVEWVESNGRQFVYLDWHPDLETFGFEVDFIIRNVFSTTAGVWDPETNTNGYGNIFGTRSGSGSNDMQLGSYSGNGMLRTGPTTNRAVAATFKKDQTRQQISLIGTTLTNADGTTTTITRTATNTAKTYVNMTVFGCSGSTRNNNGTFGVAQPGSVRIYSLKFYDGTTLAVDLVPAIRNTDSIPGLYDKVRNHFYPTSGATYGSLTQTALGSIKTVRQSVEAEIPTLTQLDTSPTRMITANAPMFTELADGQQFNIMLMHTPVKSVESERLAGWEKATSNYAYVHVKLYLANNRETDWIPAFYNPTTRLETQYIGGVSIPFVYRENYWANASTATNGTAIARGLIAGINYYDPGSNYYDRRLHNNAILAKTAIVAGHLIVSDGTGYYHIEAGATFNPAYTILYASAAIAAADAKATTYEALGSVAFTNTGTIENGEANKMLYLRCLPTNGMLTVSSTPLDDEETPHPLYLTTTPSPVDSNGNTYIYIPLGIMANATQGYFASSKDMYAFINNKFIQINPSTIIATQKLYYRTTSLTAPTAPTTWITTNNPATYKAWNLAVPPLATSTEANATKYPYLYSVEQHKRVDGTVITGEVSNDSNTTIIDGGSIITNSVTATQIAAGAITAEKLNATNINASNSLTIGALSTQTQSTILNSELSADISAAAKRTDVSIAVTAIDYAAETATLQASLYIDGVVTTSGVTYQWLKDGTTISGQTSRTLSVTSAMGLSHVYSCTATY